ncbi:MAG: LysR family transcriptional regulator [Oligoflexia bacterium]|nr:LysR family transcriptional regulator [Oligoflexia bacterium]
METERLKQFRAVVDAGGLLRASQLLGISGGGLSKSLKVLERELGYALFQQRGKGLELTEDGRRLYERVPTILSTVEDLARLKEAPLGEASLPLKLVSFEVFTTYFLGSMLTRVFPGRSVDVREAIPGQMESLIAEGQGDLGITYLPIPHAGVDFVKVGRVRMGVFGQKKAWRSPAIEELPFAVPIQPIHGAPSGVQGLDGWPDHLFPRKVLFRVEMMETALQIARSGGALVFVPEFVARLANKQAASGVQLDEFPLPTGFKLVFRDVFLIQRRGYEESAIVRKLARAIRELR